MAENVRTASGTTRAGRVTTLNSRRLVGAVINRVARALGLPTAAGLEDLRQMVDGKLSEIGKDPMDVQVVQREAEMETETETETDVGRIARTVIEVHDAAGLFFLVEPYAEMEQDEEHGRGERVSSCTGSQEDGSSEDTEGEES